MRYFGLDKIQHWTWYRRVEANYNRNRQDTLSVRLKGFERRFMDYYDVGPNDWVRQIDGDFVGPQSVPCWRWYVEIGAGEFAEHKERTNWS
jgi:hypothetical protein